MKDKASRIIELLERSPELLEAVTDLLIERREKSKLRRQTVWSSELATAFGTPTHESVEVLACPLPLDAPPGRYQVGAVFQADTPLRVYLNGVSLGDPVNDHFIIHTVDLTQVAPAGERGGLGEWDYRFSLRTGTEPKPTWFEVKSAKIILTYLGGSNSSAPA